MIENQVAYEAAKKRRIYANARKGRVARFDRDYPGLRMKLWEAREDKRYRIPDWLFQALDQWGGLTPKQAAVALRCLSPDVDKAHEQAVAEEQVRSTAAPWMAGRQDVTGVIASAKWVTTQFGSTLKALMITPDGRRLWTTIPTAIREDMNETAIKGSTMSIRVTVQPKAGDPIFAFGSRPVAIKEAA